MQDHLKVMDDTWGQMRTTDLAKAVGLGAQQVRNYEAWGFLPAVERNERGYRLYTERHLEALRTTRTLLSAGYSWQEANAIMRAVHEGNLDTALTIVDSRHAMLDQRRKHIETMLEAIHVLILEPATETGGGNVGGLRVGDAAKAVRVRPSSLRFWEQQGLLQPERDDRSGYRIYNRQQMNHLNVVVLLRDANFGFGAIRSVLDELATGRPESTLRAIEKLRTVISSSSRACTRATATLWNYIGEQY